MGNGTTLDERLASRGALVLLAVLCVRTIPKVTCPESIHLGERDEYVREVRQAGHK